MADNAKPASWSQCSPEALNGAVDLFCSFIAQPDRAAVQRWALERAKPSEVYNGGYDEWYTELYKEEVLDEATVRDFSRCFLPNTPKWFEFVREFEGWNLFISLYGNSLELVWPNRWSYRATELLDVVLPCWRFDCSYGIWERDGEPLRMHGADATDFYGRGRWNFSEMLTRLDEYTRQWFAAHGGPEEEYNELIALMEKDDLKIRLDFLDALLDGADTRETGVLYSDGTALHYRQENVRPFQGWD